MNILTSYFHHENHIRRSEFIQVLKWNLENPLIDRVIVFEEDPAPVEDSKLVRVESVRPTYQDFFNLTHNYPTDINIICNSDIFFNKTLEKANQIGSNDCYAITRHEWRADRAVSFQGAHPRNTADPAWSQDVWIFRGASRMKECDKVTALNVENNSYDVIKFWMGIGGCDNVIAKRIYQTGYNIRNPHAEIQCLHYHQNNTRPPYTHRMTGIADPWGGLLRVNNFKL